MLSRIVIASAFLITLSNPVFAQQISVPENGKINVYGNGWDCQRGFKKTGSLCEKVVTTENTRPTYPSIAKPTPALRQSDITSPLSTEQFVLRARRVQQGLMDYGYYRGEINGKAGAATKAALSKFQKDYSLTITGTITPEVLDAFGIN